jgi:HlyD family secretion protein
MKILQNAMITGFIAGLLACSGTNDTSDAYGNFEAVEIIISAETAGVIQEFKLEEGQTIREGQILGWVDTIQMDLRREQIVAQRKAVLTRFDNIKAEIAVQEQQKKNFLVEKTRLQNLLEDGAATQKQMDDLTANLDLLDTRIRAVRTQLNNVYADLEVINRQIKQVEDQIRRAYLLCPQTGTALEKYVEVFEMVGPGKALYKLADLSNMILRVYISGSQLSQIKIGQKMSVLIDKNDKEDFTLEGKIIWISPEAEFTPKIIQTKEERVKFVYAVKVQVKNDGRLKIGMPGEVKF